MKGHDFETEPTVGGAGGGLSVARRLLRMLKYAILSLLALAILTGGGFAVFANHVANLETPADPREADAIIVLTGGHLRLNAAIDLLRTGKGGRVLISGVNPITTRNDLEHATGADPELFACCIDIDHAALDTIGNAEESAKWVREHGFARVILVTNNYHMPRSMLELRRYVDGAELVPYPVVNTPLSNGDWIRKPEALRVLVTEYSKFLAALARMAVPMVTAGPEMRKAVAG